MSSPTSRTLEHQRKAGWTCAVVEKNIQPPGRRPFKRDTFGFDVLACRPRPTGQWGAEIIGIQCCAAGDHATRRTKLLANAEAAIWLASGGKLEIQSWAKKGNRWEVRVERLTLADYVPERVAAAREHMAEINAADKARAARHAAANGEVGR